MLYYQGTYQKAIKIISDNPINDVWNMLLRLSDINFLKKRWSINDENAYVFVSTALRQSYEYYLSSKSLSMKTRPLLLYYSFLNLTKAVIYMYNDERPNDYHGLCKEDIAKDIKDSSDILLFSVETNNGIFTKLGELFDWKAPSKLCITFEDFIINSIELISDYIDYFNINSNYVWPKVTGATNGDLKIILPKNILDSKNITIESYGKLFKQVNNYTISCVDDIVTVDYTISGEKKGFKLFSETASEILEDIMEYSVFDDGLYYINVAEKGKKIPNANSYYGIMYILSSIVRYKPEHIYKIIDNKDTSILWLLQRTCDIAERVYPNIMVNLLYNNNYLFNSKF